MASLLSKLYDRARHRQAGEAQGEPARGFDHLRGHKYCLLISYKRSGETVPTPVWFGLADGRLYTRSESSAWKLRRIANDPRVMVAPCSLRGKPLGPPAEGRARALENRLERERAEAAIRSSYGLGRRVYKALLGAASVETTYIEVTPT